MPKIYHLLSNSLKKLPIRFNFIIVFGIALILCYLTFNIQKKIDATSDNAVIIEATIVEVLTYIFCSIILLVCIFLFSNIIINKVRFKKRALKIIYKPNKHHIELPSVGIFPNILGFQAATLISDQKHIIAQFVISNSRLQPFSGFDKEYLQLQLSGHFNIQNLRITATDIFRMFRISYSLPCQFEIAQPLRSTAVAPIQIEDSFFNGAATNSTTVKPNDGDHTKIKPFESGDDIRRIVWKIFAKHQNLMVRLIELERAYHSELIIKTYFLTEKEIVAQHSGQYAAALLSFYKNNIWSVYQQIKSQQLQLALDTDLPNSNLYSEENSIEHTIMEASWIYHKDSETTTQQAQNIIMLHSAFPVSEIHDLLKNKSAIFIFIRLSSYLNVASSITNNLKRLFFQNTKEENNKRSFKNSTVHTNLLEQESNIIALLQSSQHIIIEA